ncbi:hypothetical protein [Tateyamaria sp.]|uniref:hypothetical protein n=1 Tax=Tateyamaria sp. TaxID=1929288 RepID=UPI00329CFE2C
MEPDLHNIRHLRATEVWHLGRALLDHQQQLKKRGIQVPRRSASASPALLGDTPVAPLFIRKHVLDAPDAALRLAYYVECVDHAYRTPSFEGDFEQCLSDARELHAALDILVRLGTSGIPPGEKSDHNSFLSTIDPEFV